VQTRSRKKHHLEDGDKRNKTAICIQKPIVSDGANEGINSTGLGLQRAPATAVDGKWRP
jgi:hypothetical protein